MRDLTVTGVQTCALPICLGQELAGVAVEQALDGAVDAVPLVAVGAVGEQAHRQHPPGAVDAVDRDGPAGRSEEHTSELQSQSNLVCRLLLEKKNNKKQTV